MGTAEAAAGVDVSPDDARAKRLAAVVRQAKVMVEQLCPATEAQSAAWWAEVYFRLRSNVARVPLRSCMKGLDVVRLDHTAPQVATAIHAIIMAAYRVEAEILGVKDFLPLRRTPEQIAGTSGWFVGIDVAGRLAAVAELEARKPRGVEISSLVVDPEFFRRGLAGALLQEIIRTHPSDDVTVSTAAGNRPALLLYAGAGFHDQRRWTTDDGIPMVTLRRGASAGPPGAAV